MSLKGAPELRARLKAMRAVFKPLAKDIGAAAVPLLRAGIPVRTGRTRASVRVKNSSQRKMTIVANAPALWIDKGTKAHTVTPKRAKALRFQSGGRTIFSRKADQPRHAARPFAAKAMHEALRKKPLGDVLTKAWNDAA